MVELDERIQEVMANWVRRREEARTAPRVKNWMEMVEKGDEWTRWAASEESRGMIVELTMLMRRRMLWEEDEKKKEEAKRVCAAMEREVELAKGRNKVVEGMRRAMRRFQEKVAALGLEKEERRGEIIEELKEEAEREIGRMVEEMEKAEGSEEESGESREEERRGSEGEDGGGGVEGGEAKKCDRIGRRWGRRAERDSMRMKGCVERWRRGGGTRKRERSPEEEEKRGLGKGSKRR